MVCICSMRWRRCADDKICYSSRPKLLNARRSRSPSSSATLSTDNEGGIKNPQENLDSASDAESTSHPDEHQIKLDTQRSFVLYHPVGEPESPRRRRRAGFKRLRGRFHEG